MAQVIRIQPDDLRNSSAKLGNISNDMQGLVKNLDTELLSLESVWEGLAQQGFMESYNNMKPILQKDLPELIAGIRKQLESAARIMEETDQKIQSAFKGN